MMKTTNTLHSEILKNLAVCKLEQQNQSWITGWKSAQPSWSGFYWFSSITRCWPCLPVVTVTDSAGVSVTRSLHSCKGGNLHPFRKECTPRSSLCTHAFHHTDNKDADVHVPDGCTTASETLPSCTIPQVGLLLPMQRLKGHTFKHLTNMVTPPLLPRILARLPKRRRRRRKYSRSQPFCYFISQAMHL